MPDALTPVPNMPGMHFPSIDDIAGILASRRPQTTAGTGELRAGVLIPLIGNNGDYDCLLTQRTDLVEHHKGQVSFPGGAADSGDSNIVATALREAGEEVGIIPSDVRILGTLNDFRTHTGFIITPVVGFLSKMPELTLQHDEVAEAFTVPLSYFADRANMATELRRIDGIDREIYFFSYRGFTIWGITARIIGDFISILEGARRTD